MCKNSMDSKKFTIKARVKSVMMKSHSIRNLYLKTPSNIYSLNKYSRSFKNVL